jgi:hypothetical protein
LFFLFFVYYVFWIVLFVFYVYFVFWIVLFVFCFLDCSFCFVCLRSVFYFQYCVCFWIIPSVFSNVYLQYIIIYLEGSRLSIELSILSTSDYRLSLIPLAQIRVLIPITSVKVSKRLTHA